MTSQEAVNGSGEKEGPASSFKLAVITEARPAGPLWLCDLECAALTPLGADCQVHV